MEGNCAASRRPAVGLLSDRAPRRRPQDGKQQFNLRRRTSRRGKKEPGAAPIDKQSRRCDLFTAACYVETRGAAEQLLIRPQAADIMGPSQSSVSGLLDCQAGFRQCSKALSDQTPETQRADR